MKSDQEKAPQDTSPPPASPPAAAGRRYEPPAICWEQPFVALAQASDIYCPIPGECDGGP